MEIEVEDFPCIVANVCHGGDLFLGRDKQILTLIY
jgi:tartrate dehydratase beta subunit/fumarate hydratase class I family protein